ncbi:serine cycle enzyme [Tersicoccus solisilvae]|uniref:Serine cycle enzyme n=1 Tax=Tersicoccus solisilvae TaxID=1882339 RepID=A0ABQ1NLV7_9MICC|nr:cyclodeaminase/cyclohydrolase family protein [Tersicoccus solisilvae]GGC77554.1 serine cycle enzyme [Tersicoccus solisilvae]
MADHTAAPAPSTEDHADLWSLPLAEFRRRTAGPEPTPGGGSVSSVTATLGVSLVQMAVHISARKAARETSGDAEAARGAWDDDARRGEELADALAEAAAADVAAFEALMRAYRLPRDGAAGEDRKQAVAEASEGATEVPLRLAETITEAVEFAGTVVDRVDDHVRSDVLAGADILAGSFHAALHTVEINLPSLAEGPRAAFTSRRDATLARLEAAHRDLRPALSHPQED